MLFLKSTPFTYGESTINLYELSALQRAEYFEFLARKQVDANANALEGLKQSAAIMRMNAEDQIWLVARSLWHADRNREINQVHDEVAQTWGSDALYAAAEEITRLSGMNASANAAGDEETEAESLEKS